MKNLGFVGLAIAALAVSGCGGGGSSPAAPAPTATTPAPAATPGPVVLSQTSVPFQAVNQTQTLTASESNYTGSFTAASSCTAVSVSPASSATGSFTLTGVSPATSGCTITVTGSTTISAAATATVPTPGGVQIRWLALGYQNLAPPVSQVAGPISIIGAGTVYAETVVVSETAYIGTFTAPTLVTAANCGGAANVTIAAVPLPVPSNAPSPTAGQSLAFYTVAVNTTTIAAAPLGGPASAGCQLTASDALAAPNVKNTGTISLVASSATGGLQ